MVWGLHMASAGPAVTFSGIYQRGYAARSPGWHRLPMRYTVLPSRLPVIGILLPVLPVLPVLLVLAVAVTAETGAAAGGAKGKAGAADRAQPVVIASSQAGEAAETARRDSISVARYCQCLRRMPQGGAAACARYQPHQLAHGGAGRSGPYCPG